MRTQAPLPSPILAAALLAATSLASPAFADPPPSRLTAVPVAPAPEDDTRALRFTAGVSLTGLGLLTAVTGGVLAVRAAVDKGQVGAHCDASARCDLTGYTLGSEAQDFARVSTVLLAAGLVGAGVGIGLVVSALPKKPGATAGIAPVAGWAGRLGVSPLAGGGLVLSGSARF